MRDFADQLERRLLIAARAEARRGPSRRLGRTVLALPRVWLAAPAVAVTTAVAVIAVVLAAATTSPTTAPVIHARVVSFRYPTRGPDSGDIIATVTDPFAAQSALDAAFQAAGLNIVVTLVPVSPSLVGTVTAMSGPASGPQIEPLGQGPCVTGSGGACAIGVKIPRDFIGQGSITLGRPAQPGEAYEATTSAFAPGESLHCSGLENQQVAEALPTIQADKITAYWDVAGSNDPPPVFGATTGPQVPDTTPPPGNYYITNANPVAAGVVWFITSPTPLSASDVQEDQATYNQGC